MFIRNLSKRLSRALVFGSSISVVCMMASGAASAQNWDKTTRVTFNVPVEIPGIGAQVLPAGTYVFRLLDSLSDRHIVQIFNADQSHLFATILAIPNYRLRPTDKTVMTFAERAAGEPQAIRAWFYPGDNSGQEFVYPKKRAVVLAKVTNQPVLYIPDEAAPNIVAPVKTATEPAVIALKEVPVKAVKPTGEDVALAEVVVPPPVEVASVQQPASLPKRLPKTASSLPLLALLGIFSVSVGLSLRTLCYR
jgi:hypothetical protein